MSSPSPKIKDHFEVLVLGGRISGWICAKILADRGLKVGLVHRETDQGQEYKILDTPHGPITEGFRALPATPGKSLDPVSEALGLSLPLRHVAESPQTFEAGKAKSFLGFGEEAPECFPILEPYLATEYQILESETLEALLRLCREGPQHLSPHEITSLKKGPQGWWVELDHQNSYLADQIYYCESPARLHNLLRTPGAKPSKDLRSLSRWEPWSSLSLTLVHKPQTVAPYVPWILMGSKLEPSLGLFESATEDRQISHWLSFLPSEVALSEEACAAAYKEMKKQLKRAFPEGVLEPAWEKISINSQSHGLSVWPQGGRELDLGEGLHLMGPAFSAQEHPLWAELLSPLEVTTGPSTVAAASAPAEIQPL